MHAQQYESQSATLGEDLFVYKYLSGHLRIDIVTATAPAAAYRPPWRDKSYSQGQFGPPCIANSYEIISSCLGYSASTSRDVDSHNEVRKV